MTIVKKSETVPYSAEQMYNLVNDLEEYPRFLPWCRRTEVHSRLETEIKATIHMAKGPLRHSFTTLNKLDKNKLIDMNYLDGPFRHLEGFWRFEDQNGGCCVTFELEYEFINKFLSLAIEPVFFPITHTIVESFKNQAEKIYGKS